MAIETELKLRVTDEQFARLKRQFRKLQNTKPVTRRLHNVYFDTPKLELYQRKIALRLRRVGGKWLQTVKGGGSVKAGLHQRVEWEVPVSGARLDFSRLNDVLSNEDFLPSMFEKLRPVFTTDFYRTSQLIDWQGARIEVCMDHGEIRTEQSCASLSEVELELKSGEPRQLFELAVAVLAIVPFELESVSKAEKGFRLLSGFVTQPVKGELPKLSQKDRLTDGLQSLIWCCLLHFQDNLQGAMEGSDAEYVHQMRVALRRLRVVLRMVEKIRADEELKRLRDASGKLGIALGKIREWDVFIAQVILLMNASGELLEYSERQRAEGYVALRMQSRELQRLLLGFAIWMNGDYWRLAEQDAPPLLDFSTRYLQRLYKHYKRSPEDLEDAQQLHALRIQLKKLRYSAEFFSALYEKHKVKPYLATLGSVQELLGGINDIAVAQRLLDDMLGHLSEHNEVIVLLKRKRDAELSTKLKMLHKALKKLDEQQPFWK